MSTAVELALRHVDSDRQVAVCVELAGRLHPHLGNTPSESDPARRVDAEGLNCSPGMEQQAAADGVPRASP